MSMDAGGLAQMTYQPNPFDNNIRHFGTPAAGFASRGKASHIKRLSVALPPKISTINEVQHADGDSTPRTSRGHLLAGLRTAPKSATVPTANQQLGLEHSRYADPNYHSRVPQTATGAYFPTNTQSMGMNNGRQMYSLPEHVLAPPKIEIEDEGDQFDRNYYDELVATNNYLAQQQRALQQQLMDVQAAAQQVGNMNLNGMGGSQFSPAPNMNLYHQQLQQGMQPIIQAVPNRPGLYQVYNPMTGQTNLVMDNSVQNQSPPQSYPELAQSPVSHSHIQRRMSPPSEPISRGRSPPKTTPSPSQDVEPLPPPSANAFRRGHKKNMSSFSAIRTDGVSDSAGPRSATVLQTPLTGTFGPGQGQAGVKPIRQPRNPINVHELMEAPTSKHPGSKNFVTRQRRRAVLDLVKAGRERQTEARQSASGSGTPGSEVEFNFSVSSDNDDGHASSSGNLSKRTSIGSLRAAAVGAIGSERKEKSRERGSIDSIGTYSVKSLSSDEGAGVGGNLVEVDSSRRKTPLLVLSNAEKRKSAVPVMN